MILTIFAITNPVLPPQIGAGGQLAGETIVGNIVSAVIGAILILGFIVAMLYFMIGGIRWLTASGDKTKLQSAQDQITQAITGLIVLAAFWAILTVVAQFTGIAVFGPGGGTFQLPSLK